jgi:prepilin-type N-terminal cleavage/methylation domain-containing protein
MRGFTLIEVLVVVFIITVLAGVIMVSWFGIKKSARVNSAKTTLRTALPAVISCNDSGGGSINIPKPSEDGTTLICTNNSTAFWPALPAGYAYEGGDYSADCDFQISTNFDSPDLDCRCTTQVCN